MSAEPATVRISDLEQTDELTQNDLFVVVDVQDTSVSSDGSDKKIRAADAIETVPIRASTDLTITKPLYEWIGEFMDDIDYTKERVQTATTSRLGVTRYATDNQATSKSASNRSITPKNLEALQASESLAGLIAIASSQEIQDGNVDDKAISPKSLFEDILGDSVLGDGNWSFKLPTRNVSGGAKTELIIQFGTTEYTTMTTGANPTTNFNHIHEYVDVNVTFPEQFPNRTLFVMAFGMEVNESSYTEGTNFFIRPRSFTRGSAVLRSTRIAGRNTEPQEAGIRYIAVGY